MGKPESQHAAMRPLSVGFLREYHECLSALDVTPAQAQVLLYLQQHPGSYILQCARAFGRTGRAVGLTVHELQHKRWVTKQRAPQDDRCVLLTVTRKGTYLTKRITRQLALAKRS